MPKIILFIVQFIQLELDYKLNEAGTFSFKQLYWNIITYHTIHPFQVCNAMAFGLLNYFFNCGQIYNINFVISTIVSV